LIINLNHQELKIEIMMEINLIRNMIKDDQIQSNDVEINQEVYL
jgi:hypothetical protein